MELQQSYKKVRFFTFPKIFFTWAGVDFPLHNDDKEGEEVEEEEEDDEEVRGSHDDGNIS